MENTGKQWKNIYLIGGIATVFVLCGIIIDMVVGSITGGDISSLPHTAIERFYQFKENYLLGLYNLDLLNIINQIILIPSIFAIYAVHRKTENASALLAMILFLVGTTIFVTSNTALTMLDLSHKYFSATSDIQKNLIAAAGEAMLAKGEHGSLGVFIGFTLPTLANFIMALTMLKGKIFSKVTAYCGLFGNTLMLFYMVLITFVPASEKLALALAMPGGLLAMAWMVLFTIKLFKLRLTD
jgi:hypothetical protein